MGVCYIAVCREKKEYIQTRGCPKFPDICLMGEEFPSVLVYLMSTRWFAYDVVLVSDMTDEYQDIRIDFSDISDESYSKWERYEK